jgi:hypothetical protein
MATRSTNKTEGKEHSSGIVGAATPESKAVFLPGDCPSCAFSDGATRWVESQCRRILTDDRRCENKTASIDMHRCRECSATFGECMGCGLAFKSLFEYRTTIIEGYQRQLTSLKNEVAWKQRHNQAKVDRAKERESKGIKINKKALVSAEKRAVQSDHHLWSTSDPTYVDMRRESTAQHAERQRDLRKEIARVRRLMVVDLPPQHVAEFDCLT